MRARADAFPQPAFNKSRETCGGTRDAPSRSAAGGQQTGPSHAMQHPLPCPVLGPEADISPSLVRKAQLLTAFTDGHGGRHSGQKRVRWRAREARPVGPSRKLRSALNRTKVWPYLPLMVNGNRLLEDSSGVEAPTYWAHEEFRAFGRSLVSQEIDRTGTGSDAATSTERAHAPAPPRPS